MVQAMPVQLGGLGAVTRLWRSWPVRQVVQSTRSHTQVHEMKRLGRALEPLKVAEELRDAEKRLTCSATRSCEYRTVLAGQSVNVTGPAVG
ncbi:hypothetical protein [Streptomyces sp. NPDC086989]|uniref:hypothetical protein n=1 Tax=Streptomyces sp. NPDC086989 TaxID=3365764 RepID=UPI003814AD26